MYKVTVQVTPTEKIDWKVVASGRWDPGTEPNFSDGNLSPEVVKELFNVTPSATDESGRNQIQLGDAIYAVVFRRLTR